MYKRLIFFYSALPSIVGPSFDLLGMLQYSSDLILKHALLFVLLFLPTKSHAFGIIRFYRKQGFLVLPPPLPPLSELFGKSYETWPKTARN